MDINKMAKQAADEEAEYMNPETMQRIVDAVTDIIEHPTYIANALILAAGYITHKRRGMNLPAESLNANALNRTVLRGAGIHDCQCSKCTANRNQAIKDADNIIKGSK